MNLPLSGLIIGLSFLPTIPIFNCIIAWIGTFLLVHSTKKQSSLLQWFLFGFLLTASQFYWAPYIFQKYSQTNYFFCTLFAIIVWGLSALQFVVVGKFTNIKSYFLILAWPILEIIFPHFIPIYLGNTQIALTHLAQVADIGGVYLVSMLMLLTGYLTLNLNFKNISILALLFGLIFAYGEYRIKEINTLSKFAEKISIGAVQPNLDSEIDFTREKLPVRMQKLMMLSGSLFQNEIDLLVWPENAVGYTYKDEQTAIERNNESDPFPALHIPLLFGAQTEGKDNAIYNSAYLMQTDGSLAGRYNKQKLFPFSESIPLSNTFPILKKIFKPAANVMETKPQGAIQFKNIDLAVAICFEDLWTALYPKLLKSDKAQIILTLANDGWFANSTAAYQHKLLASWRAIEYRRFMLRATNNGYSELISPFGEVLKSIPIKQAGSLYAEKIPALHVNGTYQKLVDIIGF